MKEFDPEIFERVVSDPNQLVDKTSVMVSVIRSGASVVFDPLDVPRITDNDRIKEVDAVGGLPEQSCRSNPHPALDAADINKSRRR